jgi:TPR repeat protein
LPHAQVEGYGDGVSFTSLARDHPAPGSLVMKRTTPVAWIAAVLLAAGAVSAEDFQAGVAAAKRGDFEAARAAWQPLAEQGDAASQYNLAMLHARGDGVEVDLEEAARWFEKAAAQGQVEAQARIGAMYARGLGVEQDYAKAAQWLQAAAEQHHVISQYELGVLYANGDGVERNAETAYFWFTLAARQGFPAAMKGQIRLRSNMPDAQAGMLEMRADEWLEEHLDKATTVPGASGG